MTSRHTNLLLSLLLVILTACSGPSHPQLPATFVEGDSVIALIPDYRDVTIPVNIAPLNFMVNDETVDECVAEFVYVGGKQTYGEGRKIIVDQQEWREMLVTSVGQDITVNLFTNRAGKWQRHPSFTLHVVGDSIDPYIAYRLIPPSYSTYENLSINERCIEDFTEKEIYNNQMLDATMGGHCINCHAFQNYRTERMQFHIRSEFAGTVIYDNGKLEKVDLKSPQTIGPGVYPAWHPSLDLIAYSVNKTFQNFHTTLIGKVEVQDSEGDLMLYDVTNHKVMSICNEPDELAAFPAWSPDGQWLYYASAHLEYRDTTEIALGADPDQIRQHEAIARHQEVKYDIYRRSFDVQNLSFGAAEKVLAASQIGKSATVPRISPDGRYLLTAMGDYGCFQIWHPESDLYVTSLDEEKSDTDTLLYNKMYASTYALTDANSDKAESYHNWSSNGRWIIFASRRVDNNYSRLYFSYFDKDGLAHKAFELPLKDPEMGLLSLKSYNVPEFIIESVRVSAAEIAHIVEE